MPARHKVDGPNKGAKDVKGALQGVASLCVVGLILHFAGVVTIPGVDSVVASVDSAAFNPDATALNGTRRAVLSKLAAPGSAKFPRCVVAAKTASKQFYVTYAEVDAQNNFGALVRNYALALVSVSGDSVSNARAEVLHVELTANPPTTAKAKELMDVMGSGWELEEWMRN